MGGELGRDGYYRVVDRALRGGAGGDVSGGRLEDGDDGGLTGRGAEVGQLTFDEEGVDGELLGGGREEDCEEGGEEGKES